jgi:hypothetical protein
VKQQLASIFLTACVFATPHFAGAQENCQQVIFPKGQTSTTIKGAVPNESPVCYTFNTDAGRTAKLKVTGTNMAMTVYDVGDDRLEFAFRTKAQAYKFLVFQQALKPQYARTQAYTVVVELK